MSQPSSLGSSIINLFDSANEALDKGVKTEVTVIMPDSVYYKLFATAIFTVFAIVLLQRALAFITK